MSTSITFWGAARTVTGSKHLLEVKGKKILIDCGMFQGGKELEARNFTEPGFRPNEIDAIVITHAHMDHIGYLPHLVKNGYRGPIYATRATKGLASISLPDSGRLQEEDAYHAAKRGHMDRATPLYTEADAYNAMRQFEVRPYHELFDLPGGVKCQYFYAGHILGSAYADLYLPSGERLLMSGDVGRWDTPIIKDPELIDSADYLVIESTYGDRDHSDENPDDHLAQVLNDAIANARTVIVPSFAIGRTQELLYRISRLEDAGRIGRIPVFVDSPMATSTSALYGRSEEEWDDEMHMMLKTDDRPIEPANMTYTRDRSQSKELNSRRGPMVIIAGSGMANGGRVVHHLLHRLSDPNTLVLFVGYQGVETLGRRLLDGAKQVRIMGEEVDVAAQIDRLSALSAHAGQNELLRFLKGFQKPPKKTFIVHGEPEVQDIFAAKIKEVLGWATEIPEHGQKFDLG